MDPLFRMCSEYSRQSLIPSMMIPCTAAGRSAAGKSAGWGLELLETADTVIVPGFGRGTEPTADEICALRSAQDRGARMVSICTGAFALAAAGLLDEQEATTH